MPTLGAVTVAQVEPSHRLIQGLVPAENEYENPAEKHCVLLVQSTLGNIASKLPDGTLVASNAQVDPFQRAANGQRPPPEL